MCANNLPKAVTWKRNGRTWTRDFVGRDCNAHSATPRHHCRCVAKWLSKVELFCQRVVGGWERHQQQRRYQQQQQQPLDDRSSNKSSYRRRHRTWDEHRRVTTGDQVWVTTGDAEPRAVLINSHWRIHRRVPANNLPRSSQYCRWSAAADGQCCVTPIVMYTKVDA